MEQRELTTTRVRPWLVALAVAMFVMLALAIGAQGGAAGPGGWIMAPTPGVDYETGNVCVEHYQTGAVCTANDVRIASITPGLAEVCLSAGDMASAQFRVELVTGAQTRYDIGLFVSTDGTSAKTGTACYHDFLQEASVSGPWDFLSGFGPFNSHDTDTCADTTQGSTVYYTFQVPVTFLCADDDGNGIVDPISTCTSWDNNANSACGNVTQAIPGTNAKCNCQDMLTSTVPILIYRGLDWGDLPVGYGTTLANDGPRHSIQNWDNALPPETQGGIVAIWLGATAPSVDYAETDGQPSTYADGDDSADTDDENGVSATYPWTIGTNGGRFTVNVNSSNGSTCPGCRLGYWIDLNGNGSFADANESYVTNVTYGVNTVYFNLPSGSAQYLYARFRLYDIYATGAPSPTGLVINGEVEDYRFSNPLDVELASFTATPQAWARSIRLDWETITEVDNLGFNLYRAESPAGRQIRLNASLIPSQGPGSPIGFRYTFVDRTALAGRTYYYWLEAVDVHGTAASYGPVSATIPVQIGVPKPRTP